MAYITELLGKPRTSYGQKFIQFMTWENFILLEQKPTQCLNKKLELNE